MVLQLKHISDVNEERKRERGKEERKRRKKKKKNKKKKGWQVGAGGRDRMRQDETWHSARPSWLLLNQCE